MISRQYTPKDILVRPHAPADDPNLILSVTPEQVGWQYLTFEVRRLAAGERWSHRTKEREAVVVDLSGSFSVRSNRGTWNGLGRTSVFTSAAHLLYLPRRTDFEVAAESASEFAVASTVTDQDHSPFLITPSGVHSYIKGGGNLTRQVSDLLPPGMPVHRLLAVEVYTPGGNWSSYPPHKHDVHREDESGNVLEANLEEIYFYRFDSPIGYAYQRVYTDQNSPLQQAGYPMDFVVRPEHNHAVVIPGGYHPVVSAPEGTTFFLCVLAGSAHSLNSCEDSRYAKTEPRYAATDTILPMQKIQKQM